MTTVNVIFTILAIIVALLIIWIVYGNTTVEVKTIEVLSKSIPADFDKFRIAHISDLHNTEFGKNNKRLLSALKQAAPKLVVITGDIIDARRLDIDKAIYFAEQSAKLAPTYYVNGNHESRLSSSEYDYLITSMKKAGATVLENDTADIVVKGSIITIVGINDLSFEMDEIDDTAKQTVEQQLIEVTSGNNNYKVLLAHRPEHIDVYEDKVNLVMSGHAHGGQFIVPFVGGLFSPGQGLLPRYYDGIYKHGKTSMIVSRGIGKSLFPFRVNNRPVIVVAELRNVE